MQLFVDMDGVLADFDTHHERIFGKRPDKKADDVDWNRVREWPNFYLYLPPMPDMPRLWSYIERHQPIVLTGIPKAVKEAPDNKRDWVRRHLGDHIEVRCCRSVEKSMHANPGDILIDDWEKHRKLWTDKGGVWITHTSAANTIRQLREMGL